MKNLLQILIVIILFLSKSYSQQYEALSLEELLNIEISTGSSSSENIFKTPSSVTVIDKSFLEKYNINSIAEAVNLISGMQVYRTYLKRDIPTSRGILQDHYANKVLVLINGVPVWNAVTGEANLNLIDINDIERVEILKGPASVVYGTNAYSGAINFILKNNNNGTNSYMSVGSHGYFSAGVNYSFNKEDYSVFISANSSDEKGQQKTFTDEKNIFGNYYEYMKGSNFTLLTKYKNHSLLFNTSKSHESFLGVEPLFASGVGKDHYTETYLLNYNYYRKLSDLLNFNLSASYDLENRNFSRSADDNTRANLKGERVFADMDIEINPFKDFTFSISGDYSIRKSYEYKNYNVMKDSTLAENNMKDRKYYEYSIYGSAKYEYSFINMQAGFRYTKNEFFGNNISGRATLVFSLNEKNSFKLIWGQSFRAPALFELYFETPTKTVFGNLNLVPEKNNSIEVAYLTSIDYFFIQALYYHSKYENKIYRDRRDPNSATDKSTIYYNGNPFVADGVEIEIKYQNPKIIDGFIFYTYIKGNKGDEVNNNDHYNFKYVPEHTLTVGLSKELYKFNISAVMNYISEVNGPKAKIKAFTEFNFSLGYSHQISDYKLYHSINVKNASDTNILFPEYTRRNLNEVYSGYGRRIYYELKMNF